VRRLIAAYAIVAVFGGLIYAPLFHVHNGGVHDIETPVVHAHFPEPEPVPPDIALTSHHSHWAARSIDVLIAAAVHEFQIEAVMINISVKIDAGHICSGFAETDDVPRAHAPPIIESHSPRSPPA
jgi:hypothetical protein